MQQRPPRAAHAGADRRRRSCSAFPTAFTLMGMGVFFAWLAYRSVNPAARAGAGARPHGAARLRRHVERRADRDSAVRLHGLPRRARGADRQAVPEPAPRDGARSGLARGRDDRHVRDLRDRDRHRRRGRHADGPARVSGDAQGRVQHQGLGGLRHRRRLSRHPDSAVGAADRVRRDGRRFGRAALRRRFFPGPHARGALPRLRHRAREVEAGAHAAARRRASAGCRCRRTRSSSQPARPPRADRPRRAR